MKIEEKFINLLSLAIPFMVIMMLIVVVSRYVFGIGQTGLQELIMYMVIAILYVLVQIILMMN